jgi:hypothetical protein
MKLIAWTCCLILLLTLAAQAEIEKVAQLTDTGLCFYWWPKLPKLKGWHQDKDESFYYNANTLAPDGSSFTKAEAIMYANAVYKPREPDIKSLDAFIAEDKKTFLAHDPRLTITEVSGLITGDGTKLRSFTFFPQTTGNWEEASYDEEGDFYLVFVLSSRSKEGFDKTQDAYRQLVAAYKANLQ